MWQAERAVARHGHQNDDLGSRSYIVENNGAAVVTPKEGPAIAATRQQQETAGRYIPAAVRHHVWLRVHGKCRHMHPDGADPSLASRWRFSRQRLIKFVVKTFLQKIPRQRSVSKGGSMSLLLLSVNLLLERCLNVECSVMKMPTLKVGTARSGLPICIFTTEDQCYIQSQLQILSPEDHFDAWAIFERLTVRELRRSGEMSDWVVKYQYYAKLHQSINSE